MFSKTWNATRLPAKEEDNLWELFHENSKTTRYSNYPPPDQVRRRMSQLLETFPYEGYESIALPETRVPLQLSLEEAIMTRVTARRMAPQRLTLEQLGTLLHYAYGISRDNKGTVFPRPFRVIPSGGALYPLEIYFHTSHVEGLEAGVYHYNPLKNNLQFLQYGDESRKLAESMVQRTVAVDSSLVMFITAVFDRSIFKYAERGYRFIFLEAGHLAQNVNLVATAMGLGVINIGGYIDQQVDAMLGFDGTTQSTIYLTAIGQRVDDGGEVGARL